MAEAIGLVASVATLITLTETVKQTVSKFVRTTKGAEKILNPVLGNLYSLHTILVTLQKQLEIRQDKSHRSMTLHHLQQPLRICENALSRIQLSLDKVKVVGNYVIGTLLDKQTLRHIQRLDGIVPILQLALEADSLASTHAIESLLRTLQLDNSEQTGLLRRDIQALRGDTLQWKLEAKETAAESAELRLRTSILKWLALSDPTTNHRAACQRHLLGTGQWLLESAEFADWVAGHKPHLWLQAMAGAGKTILASTVIQYLVETHGDGCIAYFYFDFKDTTKQDVIGLLSSLIIQTLQHLTPIPTVLLDLFHKHSARDPDAPSVPSCPELLDVLLTLLDLHRKVFIVIDALDESRERSSLLGTLTTFLTRIKVHCRVFCTSRWHLDIQNVMSMLAISSLKIQAHQVGGDVSLFLQSTLANDERLSRHREGIKSLILEKLSEGAQGMFRWVQCQVDHIRSLRTAKDVKAALDHLPPDLDSTYDDVLLRVDELDREYLKKALQFIAFSARPMTLVEIAETVIIEPDMSELDEDARLQRPEDLLEIGRSLLVPGYTESLDKATIELAHYSVKEYLLSERITNGPVAEFALEKTAAEIHISQCCLTYLGMDVFEQAWQEFDRKTWDHQEPPNNNLASDFLTKQHNERLEAYPFLAYAAKNCFTHCKDEEVQKAIIPTFLKAFSTERSGRFINMTYTCVYNPNESCMTSYTRAFRYSLISVAARYGLAVFVQELLNNDVPADYMPPKPFWIEAWPEGQTALHRAAEAGFMDICKMLIDAGADLHGTSDRDCPLASAGRSGKPEIVQLLIDSGVDVRRDPFPVTEALLIAWWKYAEGFEEWKSILDVFRSSGVRWSVVGLLSAFSGSVVTMTRVLTELRHASNESAAAEEFSLERIQDAVNCLYIRTLTALQWLVNDPQEITGVKSSILGIFEQIFHAQPQLFISTTATGPIQKYTLEEVFAENMINRYFKMVPTATSVSVSVSTAHQMHSPKELLATGCEMLPEPVDADLIICGPILRAFVRNRWDPAFAHLFD